MNTLTLNKPNLSELKQTLLTSGLNDKSTMLEEYAKFLFLIKKYPAFKAVPTKSIDAIWHYHFYNTELYTKDCNSYFGRLIKHKEASSETELLALKKNYDLTNKLWYSLFHTRLGDTSQMAICGVDGGDDGGDNGGGGHGGNDFLPF